MRLNDSYSLEQMIVSKVKSRMILILLQYQPMSYQRPLYTVFLICLLIILGTSYVPYQYKETMERLQDLFDSLLGGTCKYKKERDFYHTNIAYLASLEQSGYFDVKSSPLLNNSYNVSEITFKSIQTKGARFEFPDHQFDSYRAISGMISLPKIKKLKGVILYNFPVTLDKSRVPSARKHKFYRAVAALYGSQGYSVVFLDYLGMGLDSANAHPYLLFPQQQVRAGISLLSEALKILNKWYGNHTSENPWPLMVSGYSQGANYAVWFSICRIRQAWALYRYCDFIYPPLNEAFQLVGIAGMNGAYDLKGVFREFLFSNVGVKTDGNKFRIVDQQTVNIAKPALAVFSIFSWSSYTQFSLSSAFIPSYYNLECLEPFWRECLVDYKDQISVYDLSRAFSRTNLQTIKFSRALGYSAFGKSNNGVSYISDGDKQSDENNVLAFINQEVLEDKGYFQALEQASTVGYGNTSPQKIFIFSFAKNSVISPLHSFKFAKYNASGNVFNYTFNNEKFSSCTSSNDKYLALDHVYGQLLSNIFTLHFFNTKLGL